MKSRDRNKPCICGSGLKTKKCFPNHNNSKNRNKPCECGSGIETIKCCETMLMELKKMENNNLFQEYQKYKSDEVFGEFQSVQSQLVKNHIYEYPKYKKEDFPNCIETKVFTDKSRLRKDTIWKMNKVISQFRLVENLCYENSFILSSYIDEVDKVVGWMGKKKTPIHYGYNIVSSINSNVDLMTTPLISTNPQNDNEYIIHDKKDDFYYVRHSWNKVGNVHFDLTPHENLFGGEMKYVRYSELPNTYNQNEKEKIQFGLGLKLKLDIFGKHTGEQV
jgi:hypothetical protein